MISKFKLVTAITIFCLLSIGCSAVIPADPTEAEAEPDAAAEAVEIEPTAESEVEANDEVTEAETEMEESEATEAEAEVEESAEVADADTSETAPESVTDENVEIYLTDTLDGILNGYCLDIAGGNQNVDPANGLQAHTCYSYQGDLGTDQVFGTARFVDDVLYMPIYDVCAQVASLDAGAEIGLATCDGSDLQSIVFGEDGTIRPAGAPDLCFTANAESRFGRGSDHQIRDLSLEVCSEDLAGYQQWATRIGLN